MAEQPIYERFLRTTFPTLFASVVALLGDEEEAALVAQRLVLRAYYNDPDTPPGSTSSHAKVKTISEVHPWPSGLNS